MLASFPPSKFVRPPLNLQLSLIKYVHTGDVYRTCTQYLFKTFCSRQIYDLCFIQVTGGAFTFRISSVLDTTSGDYLMLVCSSVCVVIGEDEQERRKRRQWEQIVCTETGYPPRLPINSK